MIPDAHDLLDLLSLDVDQENLEEKSADDGGRAISAGEEQDEGPRTLERSSRGTPESLEHPTRLA